MSDTPNDTWFGTAWRPWMDMNAFWRGLAPEFLNQPINPGWSFGNVVINQRNSTAPQVEQDVVAQHSYGRQIGRLMDVVGMLVKAHVEAQPKLAEDSRVEAFRRLATEIEDIKKASARSRLERLREELEQLKQSDPQAWERLSEVWRK